MKKLALSLFALALVVGPVFGNLRIDESLTNSTTHIGRNFAVIELVGETIPTDSSITFDLHDIGAFDSIDGTIASVSSGNITTANISWEFHDVGLAANAELTSEVITFGTAVTSMKSGRAQVTIYNPVSGIPVTVTGNMIISDD